MRHRFVDRIVFAAAACCALCVVDRSVAATEVWRNDWYSTAPPTLNLYWPVSYDWIPGPGKPSVAFASAADGDLLFGAASPQYLDYQFARIHSDGSPRWGASIYAGEASSSGAYAILATDDGGALIADGYSQYDGDIDNRIVRIDGVGVVAWSRSIPTGWIAQPAPDRLASAGCSRLSVLDATNGNLIWQHVLASERVYCSSGGLVPDPQGNLYATVEVASANEATGFRALKFDPDGNVLWDIPIASPGGGHAVAVDANTLYVVTKTELRAVRVADGSSVWMAPVDPFADVLLSDDAAHEPIVIGTASVQRIASDTGMPRWNTPLAELTHTARIVDGVLLVATSSGRAKLDVSNGAIAWHLPNDEGSGQTPDWLGFGDHQSGTFAAVARVLPPAANAASALVEHLDFATGALAADIAVSAFPLGIKGRHLVDGGADMIGFGISEHPDRPALNLRRLDATGAVLWENTDSLDEFGGAVAYPTPVAEAGLGSDSIAVALPLRDRGCNDANMTGWARIALYDRASGVRRWRILLRDADQQCTFTSAPKLDPLGNVFVSVSALTVCPPPKFSGCQRRTLYKLSAVDGAVMWRSDEAVYAGIEGLVLYPQELTLMGFDVLVAGASAPDASVQRYAAADGSLQWTSDVLGENVSEHIDTLDAQHIVVHGGFTDVRWAELDADTGHVLWSSSAPTVPCAGSFGCAYFGEALVVPGGDLLWPGERDYKANLRRLHNDGSGIIDDWTFDPDSPSSVSLIDQVVLDSTGEPHLLLHRGDRQARGSVTFLAGFDLASGTLRRQQALYGYIGNINWSNPDLLTMPAVDRLLASTDSANAPLPTTSGATLYDLRVTAYGDLAAEVDIDRTQVAPGMQLGFHAKASYDGDQAIAAASLMLILPWPSGATDFACSTQSASHCVIDSRSGNLRATFDAMPGGSIEISGKVRVLDTIATPVVHAYTYGPTGLSEQDTINNFARSVPTQSLFFDGFDTDH